MKLWDRLHGRAARVASYGLLLAAMLLVFLVWPALVESGLRVPWLLSALFVGVLIACLAAALDRARAFALVLLALVALEALSTLGIPGDPDQRAGIQYALRLAGLGLTGAILLRDVMRACTVTADTILGAVCVYLLLAIAWAAAYALVHLAGGEAAFTGAALGGPAEADATNAAFLYYSLVTMTTLGYGDVVPVSALARSLATMQAVFGQLYIAIIVARLVAVQVTGSEGRAGKDDRTTSADA